MSKPSERCKAAGFKSMKQLAQIAGYDYATIRRWATHHPYKIDKLIEQHRGKI